MKIEKVFDTIFFYMMKKPGYRQTPWNTTLNKLDYCCWHDSTSSNTTDLNKNKYCLSFILSSINALMIFVPIHCFWHCVLNVISFLFQFLSDVDRVFVHSVSNICFIRYYLIVFIKHHFITIKAFVRKKMFIIFKDFLLSLILII